jgi:hypothetical protein
MDEINNLVNEIEKTNNWNNKLELIKQVKQKIKEEDTKLSELEESLDEIKKVSLKKTNFDDLITEFEKTQDINEKIKIYQILNSYVCKVSNELFSQ